MATNKGISVKIMGKDYQVACPEDETHHLLDAALLLDSKMRDIRNSGRVIGLERIAVMAALNLAHEMLQLREEIKAIQNDTDRRLLQMHAKIEDALVTE